MSERLVVQTARCSLFTQFTFLLVTATSLVVPLAPKDDSLYAIATLETIAQAIEFVYYAYFFAYKCGATTRGRIPPTYTRYIDWALSTPVMLLSTLALLRYLRFRRSAAYEADERVDVFADVLVDYGVLWTVLGLNWLMLALGFVVEWRGDALRPGARLALLGAGHVVFVANFVLLFATKVRGAGTPGLVLWLFLFFVWGAYGVAAALLGDGPKNVAYNLLDIVSKNVYGLLVLGIALSVAA